MSTIIECPACSTRYKMNKAIPEGGRSVKCARCGHQWRIAPEEPEELSEALVEEAGNHAPAAHDHHAAPASPAMEARHESAPHAPQTIGDAWDMRPGYAPADEERPHPQSPPAASQTIGDAWDVRPDHLAQSQPEAYPADTPAAPQTIGDAWDVRRGNLAATIASMGVAPDTPGDETAGGIVAENSIVSQPWNNADVGFPPFAAEPGRGDAPAAALHGRGHDEAGEQDDASYEPPAPPAWASTVTANADWMRNAAEPDPVEIDPEMSVRQALKAAMDDETADAGAFGAAGAASPVTRPVFTDPGGFDDTMSGFASKPAAPMAGPPPEEPPLRSKPLFASASAHAAFAPEQAPRKTKGRMAPPIDPETEADEGGKSDDTEKFENDIVGIFRQQMQEKRSFRPSTTSRKAADDDFTDYDSEIGGGAQADDRFMADGPLDTDAAALQAALEGSLRERHAEDGGGGGLALAAAWAVFISVLSGVTLAFITFRDEMVVALPGTTGLYRGLGFDVQDRQVDFGPVSYRWTVAEGKPMIEVTGQIINLTDREIAVPRVLVNVHDKDNTDTVKATATVRSEPLAAHETADFTLEFLSPPKSISQIELAFAEAE